MKNNKGFSLVELIVVIAIMAILAAVAVIGVSVYIPKAQQANDKQLVSDIEDALIYYYYSDPTKAVDGAYIVLTTDGAKSNDEFIIEAMEATFGADWTSELVLSYDGWNSEFQDSNFYGDEQAMGELLGTVETLTGALSDFLANDAIAGQLGSGFGEYMTGLGANTPAEKADAAVFYVADVTAGLSPDALQNASNAIMENVSKSPVEVMGAMNPHLGGSTITSAATLYALAEGYASFFDNNNYPVKNQTDGVNKTPRQILDEATNNIEDSASGYTDTVEAFAALLNAFQVMANVNPDAIEAYTAEGEGNPLSQDLNAFADAMSTISKSKDSILNDENTSLGAAEGYFSNNSYVQNMLNDYANGGVFVYVKIEDNALRVSSNMSAD